MLSVQSGFYYSLSFCKSAGALNLRLSAVRFLRKHPDINFWRFIKMCSFQNPSIQNHLIPPFAPPSKQNPTPSPESAPPGGIFVNIHFFPSASSNPGICSFPTGIVMLEPLKSSLIGSYRPPRQPERKASVTALKDIRFSGRTKPWPSSG